MYFVSTLKSVRRKYIYAGLINDVERRIGQHEQGSEKTTASYRPFKIISVEKYASRPEARKREKYLKSGSGKEWIKKQFS
jgi:putative endonuclease